MTPLMLPRVRPGFVETAPKLDSTADPKPGLQDPKVGQPGKQQVLPAILNVPVLGAGAEAQDTVPFHRIVADRNPVTNQKRPDGEISKNRLLIGQSTGIEFAGPAPSAQAVMPVSIPSFVATPIPASMTQPKARSELTSPVTFPQGGRTNNDEIAVHQLDNDSGDRIPALFPNQPMISVEITRQKPGVHVEHSQDQSLSVARAQGNVSIRQIPPVKAQDVRTSVPSDGIEASAKTGLSQVSAKNLSAAKRGEILPDDAIHPFATEPQGLQPGPATGGDIPSGGTIPNPNQSTSPTTILKGKPTSAPPDTMPKSSAGVDPQTPVPASDSTNAGRNPSPILGASVLHEFASTPMVDPVTLGAKQAKSGAKSGVQKTPIQVAHEKPPHETAPPAQVQNQVNALSKNTTELQPAPLITDAPTVFASAPDQRIEVAIPHAASAQASVVALSTVKSQLAPVNQISEKELISLNTAPLEADLNPTRQPEAIPRTTVITPTAELARNVAVQIATSVIPATDGAVEIRLDPIELGKVRLTLLATDTGINVQVLADRPETAELIRRNTLQLEVEFEKLGFKEISFEFSHNQQNASFAQPDEDNDIPWDEMNEPHPDPVPHLITAPTPRSTAGLDLRL